MLSIATFLISYLHHFVIISIYKIWITNIYCIISISTTSQVFILSELIGHMQHSQMHKQSCRPCSGSTILIFLGEGLCFFHDQNSRETKIRRFWIWEIGTFSLYFTNKQNLVENCRVRLFFFYKIFFLYNLATKILFLCLPLKIKRWLDRNTFDNVKLRYALETE